MDAKYDSLPNWMRKFPPNYEIRDIPGVEGYIQEEAMGISQRDDLPFFFYLSKYPSEKPSMSGDEELELIMKVQAWLKKNNITGLRLVRGDDDYDISANNYWAYLPISSSTHKTWIDYWKNRKEVGIINHSGVNLGGFV